MAKSKNQVFLPTVAEFSDDIETSWELQKPLAQAGYTPGFMLFIRRDDERPRVQNLENVQKQYGNLEKYVGQYGNAAIITMLSNTPPEQIDPLHNPQGTYDHVCAGIDFAKALPIGGRRIVTFHTNALVSAQEFQSHSKAYWRNQPRQTINEVLKKIGKHAKAQGVDVLVETYPVPVWGDWPEEKEDRYRGVKLRHLRDVAYLFADNGAWRAVTSAGLGICFDLCHQRTIHNTAERGLSGILFEGDIEEVKALGGLANERRKGVRPRRDIVHLNDGAGEYDDKGGIFQEGVALGKGDITELPEIIAHLNQTKTPFVLELNEKDFTERPNTRTSIRYLLAHQG